jgi:hypothetical protein
MKNNEAMFYCLPTLPPLLVQFNHSIFHVKGDGTRDLPQLKPLMMNELETLIEIGYILKWHDLLSIAMKYGRQRPLLLY